MPARSPLDTLPPAIIEEMNARLVRSGFGDYDGLTAWLREQGYEVSRAAVARRGKRFQEQWQESMADARSFAALVKANRESGGADDRAEALGAIADQAGLMLARILVQVRELMDEAEAAGGLGAEDDAEATGLDLAKATKLTAQISLSIAKLGEMGVKQRKWAADQEERVAKRARAEGAAAAEEVLAEAGVTDEQWALLRARFLGVKVSDPTEASARA